MTSNLDLQNEKKDKLCLSRSVWSQQREFIWKELRETLRDRRTTVTLMLMPLLLYPLLGLGFRFVAVQQAATTQRQYQIGLASEAEANRLGDLLRLGETRLEINPFPPDVQFLIPQAGEPAEVDDWVRQGVVDLGIRCQTPPVNPATARWSGSGRVEILQNANSEHSRDAADYLEKRLQAANAQLITRWTQQNQLDFTWPLEVRRTPVQSAETTSALLGILPLILLLMTVTGGVYPAIDLTAGERERNTLEILMALPVPPFRLLLAKFVAVFTVTLLTGLMNLLAMSVTLYALQLDRTLLGEQGLTLLLGLKLLLILAAFGLFYSAVLLLLTGSARSFKEAQAYLIPLLLLSLAPGLVILLPGWNLASLTAVLPLVNLLLLAREVLEGTVQPLPAFVAITSTVFYALATLVLAARVFGADAVAVGSRGTWTELLQRPTTADRPVSLISVSLTLAIVFPAYFLASGLSSRVSEVAPSTRLLLSAGLTMLLFGGLPGLFLWHQRVNWRTGIQAVLPHWTFLPAAFLLGLGIWPWIYELILLLQSVGIRGIDLSRIEDVEQLLASWQTVPLWLMLLTLGVVPGIFEECFFRGYLWQGLRQALPAVWTILLSAVAFGLFHVVLAGGAAPERLIPSTLMGVLLGVLTWRSGSVIPAMILHAVHNCALLWLANSRNLLAEWNIGQMNQAHLPATWLLASSLVIVFGCLLIYWQPVPQPPEEQK